MMIQVGYACRYYSICLQENLLYDISLNEKGVIVEFPLVAQLWIQKAIGIQYVNLNCIFLTHYDVVVLCVCSVRSRSLLLYDESSPLEDGHGSFLRVEAGDGWEGAPLDYTVDQPKQVDHATHETNKYLSKEHSDPVAYDNRTGAPFLHSKEQYHKRWEDQRQVAKPVMWTSHSSCKA